jgi:predicted ATP-dependent Lon-type protease
MSGTEALGVFAIVIMVGSYALEKRSPVFIASFAVGCALAATYALLIKSYPFLIAEGIWAVIAANRWRQSRANESSDD